MQVTKAGNVVAEYSGAAPFSMREDEFYQQIGAKSVPVCVADVRRVGDLWPEYGRGAAPYPGSHNEEEDYAWASLWLGRPVAGQRAADIVSLARGAKGSLDGAPDPAASADPLNVPAIYAAALDPAIDALYLAGDIPSYCTILDTEDYSGALGNFVPNILLYTNIAEVLSSLEPRRVWRKPDLSGIHQALAEM